MVRKFFIITAISIMLITLVACDRKTDGIEVNNMKEVTMAEKNQVYETPAILQITQQELVQKDFILYYVNCASGNVTELAEGDYMGIYQSVTDQSFETDAETGMKWGYIEKPYMIAKGDLNSPDKTAAKWVIAEGTQIIPDETGFYYDFSVPEGEYEVTCGFYDPFSARPISIQAEGELMVKDLKILKYQLKEATFTKKVTDGVLNLLIYNPTSGDEVMKDPILSYIIIRAVPDYNKQLLTTLIETLKLTEEESNAYVADSVDRYQTALSQVKEILALTDTTEDEYKQAYKNLKGAYDSMEKKPIYTSFRPGEEWKDTEGNLIQAHGGQIQRLTVKDKKSGKMVEKWWWVGEDKTNGSRGGICAYSSHDLYNWTFEGIVMRNVSSREQLDTDEYFTELYKDYTKEQLDNVYTCINSTTSIIERPKMIYCEATGQYVLWFHADGPTETSSSSYAAASAGVAVSSSPSGPFKFIDRYRLNICPEDQEDQYPDSKGMARDMNLFLDDDGTAYIIYSSEENLTLYISKLNDTYTYLSADPKEAVYGEDFIRIFPGAQREAPAVFKKGDTYYMMTSGCTGWKPNQAKMFKADAMLGDWKDMGDPCVGDNKKTTFDSQSTCIFLADEESQTYIYMGDRWNSEDLANSRYVWLPIQFDTAGNVRIEFVKEWQLQQVIGKH